MLSHPQALSTFLSSSTLFLGLSSIPYIINDLLLHAQICLVLTLVDLYVSNSASQFQKVSGSSRFSTCLISTVCLYIQCDVLKKKCPPQVLYFRTWLPSYAVWGGLGGAACCGKHVTGKGLGGCIASPCFQFDLSGLRCKASAPVPASVSPFAIILSPHAGLSSF